MGTTILQAALAAGHEYPHSCQSGNCGACKSKLFSGEIEMSPFSEFALTRVERASGFFLACRAVPWSDCEVAFVASDEIAVHPQRSLRCEVEDVAVATHDIRVLRLRADDREAFEFTAGQYARLRIGALPQREYSMASLPGEDLLEFHVRLVPGGTVSMFVHERLRKGDVIEVEGPHGIAHWRERHRGPVIALAGGSGLAPIKAIVLETLRRDPDAAITLYFGVRDERDLYAEQQFRSVEAAHPSFRFTPVLSNPSGATSRRTGLLADVLREDGVNCTDAKAYLAGPPPMVESCTIALRELGLPDRDCHADAFYTEADKVRNEAAV